MSPAHHRLASAAWAPELMGGQPERRLSEPRSQGRGRGRPAFEGTYDRSFSRPIGTKRMGPVRLGRAASTAARSAALESSLSVGPRGDARPSTASPSRSWKARSAAPTSASLGAAPPPAGPPPTGWGRNPVARRASVIVSTSRGSAYRSASSAGPQPRVQRHRSREAVPSRSRRLVPIEGHRVSELTVRMHVWSFQSRQSPLHHLLDVVRYIVRIDAVAAEQQ